jgi:hypothetical protein
VGGCYEDGKIKYGFRFPVGARDSSLLQSVHLLLNEYPSLFPSSLIWLRGMNLTTHLRLVARIRGSLPPLSHESSLRGV